MKYTFSFALLFFGHQVFSQNQVPVITNVSVSLGSGTTLTLQYDLSDAENDPVGVTFRATGWGGQVFDYETGNATGDVGPGIVPGPGKQIEWDFSAYAANGLDFRVMLVADDGQPVDIHELVLKADSLLMKSDMDFLEGVRHRHTGPVHLQETKDFLQSRFQQHELETYLQEFSYGGYQAANIIGRKIGISEESHVYILDGHFDSVSNSPGADDNASAVAGVLEALRVLAPYSFEKSIKFIGFDLEEAGLVGSIRYVQNGILPNESVLGVLNFEMIGYYTEVPNTQELPPGFNLLFPGVYAALQANQFRGDFINSIGESVSSGLLNAFEDAAANYVPELSVISIQAPSTWQVLTPDLGRSDHAPFWGAGIPALMLTDGAEYRNENYHTPNDKSDILNFTFMRQVTQAAIATLAELAVIRHASTWWTDVQLATSTQEINTCAFEVYPNPARDMLCVSWPSCQLGNFDLDLVSIEGEVVRRFRYQSGQGNVRQWIDVHNLDRGVYFLRISSGEQKWVKKVIVG